MEQSDRKLGKIDICKSFLKTQIISKQTPQYTLYGPLSDFDNQIFIKLFDSNEDFYLEKRVISHVRLVSNEASKFPKILREGKLHSKNFIVFKLKGGCSLEDKIHSEQFSFDLPSIFELGMQMLTIFETMHEAGYCYGNNLTLKHIIFTSNGSKNINGSLCCSNVSLINFERSHKLASSYDTYRNPVHIENQEYSKYSGEVLFASLSQMEMQQTSRRDDLIGLLYVMVYLLKGDDLSWLKYSIYMPQESMRAYFKKIYQLKKDLLSDMHANIGNWPIISQKSSDKSTDTLLLQQQMFIEFSGLILGLGFDEAPNYIKLRRLLTDMDKLESRHGFFWVRQQLRMRDSLKNQRFIEILDQELAQEIKKAKKLKTQEDSKQHNQENTNLTIGYHRLMVSKSQLASSECKSSPRNPTLNNNENFLE